MSVQVHTPEVNVWTQLHQNYLWKLINIFFVEYKTMSLHLGE